MELSTYVAELRDSLTAAASVGDEHTQHSAAALATALEPAARLALLHALSDLAVEVTKELSTADDPIRVDVRLEGRDVRVVTTRAAGDPSFATFPSAEPHDDATSAAPDADEHRSFVDASNDLTRTTVRMFNELKAQAEKAASDQGVSLNQFISRAVSESVRGKGRRGHRPGGEGTRRDWQSTISGYVQG